MKDCENCFFRCGEDCDLGGDCYSVDETQNDNPDTCEVCKYFTAENEEFGFCDSWNGLIVNPSDGPCEYFEFDSEDEEEE